MCRRPADSAPAATSARDQRPATVVNSWLQYCRIGIIARPFQPRHVML